MNAFRFEDPWWLLLFLPVAWITWRKRSKKLVQAIVYSSIEGLKARPRSLAGRLKPWLEWLWPIAAMLVVLAIARPQLGREEVRLNTDGIAIMMSIDRSGSMNALDFEVDERRVNRLEVVKQVFRDFVQGAEGFQGRPDDLIGLVAFGGFAESKCPPTLDHDTLLKILETVKLPEPIVDSQGRVINEDLLREEQATAIGDALGTAVDRLKDLKIKSKVIVLLSDGESNAGVLSPEEAAEAAKAYGIKIYCIGVGSNGQAPFLMTDAFGRKFLQNQLVRMDEATLKSLAEKTGGQYFNAKDTQALRGIYEQIDQLEKTQTEGKIYTDYRDLYPWLILPGIALVVLEKLLTSTRFRSIP